VFFKPTVEVGNKEEEIFLPADPIDLITQGKFHKVPFLTGINSNEGLLCLKGSVFMSTHLIINRAHVWSVVCD
jgi:carboxylesterase type B